MIELYPAISPVLLTVLPVNTTVLSTAVHVTLLELYPLADPIIPPI